MPLALRPPSPFLLPLPRVPAKPRPPRRQVSPEAFAGISAQVEQRKNARAKEGAGILHTATLRPWVHH